MTIRSFSGVVCATTLAALAACSTVSTRTDPYATGPVPAYTQAPVYSQAPAYAAFGTVAAIEVVPVRSRATGAGAVLGAVLGAAIGNQIGSGTGRAAATVAGAVGGGIAGNAIEKRTRRDDEVFRVAVRFDDGTYREFDFQRVDDLRIGDRVKWDGGQLQMM